MSGPNDSNSGPLAPVVSRDTLVPLGSLVLIVSVFFAAYGYFQHQFGQITAGQTELIRRVDRLEERQLDRWTQTDQALWILSLAKDNPSLVVPPPARAPNHKASTSTGSRD